MPEKFNYQRYLASREWAVLREAVRARCHGRCERCISAMKSVHHLTYERIGHEELGDLLGVCDRCHAWLSGKSSLDPARLKLLAFYGRLRMLAGIRMAYGKGDEHGGRFGRLSPQQVCTVVAQLESVLYRGGRLRIAAPNEPEVA